jgi:adenine C2-methylase RlmN of 23S rRNA A2503 and tRNA A37
MNRSFGGNSLDQQQHFKKSKRSKRRSTMPMKRRQLNPQSLFDEQALKEWLGDLNVKYEQHVRLIWKHSETLLMMIPDAAAKETKYGGGGDDDDAGTNSTTITIRSRHADLPKIVYERLPDQFVHCTSRVIDYQSSDHGGKLLIELQNGLYQIETVIILHHHHHQKTTEERQRNHHHHHHHHHHRATVCISSQVGCRMKCTFCATGTMGLVANLTAGELVEQVWHARQHYPSISNVVLMGMGEPLDNYQVVKDAILSLSLPPFHIPLSRITVSTVGANPSKIRQLALDCPGVSLAISLHAPNDMIRQQIVPTAKQQSLDRIMTAVRFYQDYHPPGHNKSVKKNKSKGSQKSVMMEYIMIAGINDSIECAHELGNLLQGREYLINLIPYNPTVAGDVYAYQSPSDDQLKAFQDVLYQYPSANPTKPLTCTIRWSSQRGQSLEAACGQLVLQQQQQSPPAPSQQQQQPSRSDPPPDETTRRAGEDVVVVVVQDMEDLFGTESATTRKVVASLLLPTTKKGVTAARSATAPARNETQKDDDDDDTRDDDKNDDDILDNNNDDEESILSWSFLGPILWSGLVAVGVTVLILQWQQRRVVAPLMMMMPRRR